VDDEVSKSSKRRGEVSIVLQVETKMTLENVTVSSIYRKLLDLNSLQNQQLFKSIVELLTLEKLLKLMRQVFYVLWLEFDT